MKNREQIYKELVKEYLLENFEVPLSGERVDYITRQANIYAVQNTNKRFYEQMEKTSQEWIKDGKYKKYIILDPDGWDRKNYEYSFNQEKITEQEFTRRLVLSTIRRNK